MYLTKVCIRLYNGVALLKRKAHHKQMPGNAGWEDTVMKKKEFLAGAALLAASSALCMKIMKKVGEKLKKQQEKGQNTGRR